MAIQTKAECGSFSIGRDILKVNLNELAPSGRIMVDVRRWYLNDADELRPSAKGTSVPLEKVDELIKFLQAAKQAAKK